jgi:hypothetical protein
MEVEYWLLLLVDGDARLIDGVPRVGGEVPHHVVDGVPRVVPCLSRGFVRVRISLLRIRVSNMCSRNVSIVTVRSCAVG